MVATPSVMLPLGSPLPAFALPDLDGRTWTQADLVGAPSVVAFVCPHCPYVKHLEARFGEVAADLTARGARVVAVQSNDVDAYPQDGPEGMRAQAAANGWSFPYLRDEDQAAAAAFRAACTPDLFVYDAEGRLAYRGQFDDSRPGNDRPVTGADLVAAVDALLAGTPVAADQIPSIGCNIKWRPGHEPGDAG